MNESHFDALSRRLTNGSITRRAFSRGLAGAAITVGVTIAGGLSRVPSDDAEAKKRKKNKKKRKGRGGNQGAGPVADAPAGDAPGGEPPCTGTLCNGQCVDLETDQNNCGACGDTCPDEATCVEGQCVEAVGDQGSGDNQFNNPAGIAFDGGETFFVTDSGNQRVVTLFEGTFGDNFAVSPFGVAVNTVTADVYVTGTGTDTSALFRFTSNGVLLGTFGSFGGGIEQFRNPLGVAIDDKGGVSTNQVFVADTGNSRIQRMSATGFFTARFGREGSGDGEFRNPEGIAIAADRSVVVADTGNNRIQVLTQGGSLIHAFGSQGSGDGQFNRPVGVAINENGDLFVVDQGNNRVQRFNSDGQFLDAFGRQGSGIGQFDRPTGITVGNSGVIAVVDSGNHRVQGFFSPASPSDNLSIETQSSFLQPSASDSGKRKPNSQDPSHQDRKRGVGPSRR